MLIVALMHGDGRIYEVAREGSTLYVRARGTRKWESIHPGLNPTLEAYLANCAGNFGWTWELTDNA